MDGRTDGWTDDRRMDRLDQMDAPPMKLVKALQKYGIVYDDNRD